MNAFLETLLGRASARDYTGAPVPRDQLELMLRAAQAAPSAVDVRPWAFVVVTDRPTLDALAEGLPYAKMLRQAGAGVVVCGLPEKNPPYSREFWVQDCAAATENLLLAAHALGWGAVWTAVHPDHKREDFVRRALGLPKEVVPLNVVPIGLPRTPASPKRKDDPAAVHWDRWA